MKKKVIKFIGYTILVLLLLVLGLMIYVKTMLPSVGAPPDLKVELTPERIERGRYLANHVMLCVDCHSTRDWSLFSGPLKEGTHGKGGEVFDQQLGFPGKYIAPNITPSSLSGWTDGEIFRAITTGVSKDGHALFPIMPYLNYGQLDEEDIKDVIAYIRTLQPIENKTAASSSDFPMNFIINTIPQKAKLQKKPAKTDLLAYGKYITTAAGCGDCHTKQEKGSVVGEPFAGGFEFKLLDGSVVTSSNITPDASTGIGNWTKQQFVNRFRIYADSSYTTPTVAKGDFQTIMPWVMYAKMDSLDLEAIYTYLKSLKPVNNSITKFTTNGSLKN